MNQLSSVLVRSGSVPAILDNDHATLIEPFWRVVTATVTEVEKSPVKYGLYCL